MSKEYDQHAKLRVTPSNLKALDNFRKTMLIKSSRDAVANAAIAKGLVVLSEASLPQKPG